MFFSPVARPAVLHLAPIEPPGDLPPEEQEVWRGIVRDLPDGWIAGDNAVLLRQLVEHIVNSRPIAYEIERMRGARLNLAKRMTCPTERN